MKTVYLIKGIVTTDDAVEAYWDGYGLAVAVGDVEWRLADDPDNPGSSADFPTLELAVKWAQEKDLCIVPSI